MAKGSYINFHIFRRGRRPFAPPPDRRPGIGIRVPFFLLFLEEEEGGGGGGGGGGEEEGEEEGGAGGGGELLLLLLLLLLQGILVFLNSL